MRPYFKSKSDVYCPEEDSFMLAGILEGESLEGKSVLDMGCGTGILGIAAAISGASVTSVDISPLAVDAAKENFGSMGLGAEILRSDLFENLEGKRFDMIVFNPPYLPDDRYDKSIDTSGGPSGREIIERFILEAGKHLNHSGRILLLVSSLTGEKEILQMFDREGFSARVISRKKIPWEELIVIQGEQTSTFR